MNAVGTNFTHLYKIVTAASFELLESRRCGEVFPSANRGGLCQQEM